MTALAALATRGGRNTRGAIDVIVGAGAAIAARAANSAGADAARRAAVDPHTGRTRGATRAALTAVDTGHPGGAGDPAALSAGAAV